MSPPAIAPPSSSCTEAPEPRVSGRRVLVADDDPSTRQFLAGAIQALGFAVTLARDGAEALDAAGGTRFDALLLDCRMPHAGALAVLHALRTDAGAASRDAVALATSAEVPTSLRDTLLQAGFAGVIEKPCQVASLGHALGATLGVDPTVRLLDDRESLVATGDPATMHALRGLLRDELDEFASALEGLAADPRELVERLHRLRSACGFCGATRLGAQARALQNHTLETGRAIPASIDCFRAELMATLRAMDT